MYTPRFNLVGEEAEIRSMVDDARVGWLISATDEAVPLATFLPVIWQDDVVITHMAKANSHWRHISQDSPGLIVVTGPDAYVTPSWYPTKAEHGRTVPTWNYTAVHLSGPLIVRDDPDWLRMAVTELTDRHEQVRDDPWAVTDAPADYVDSLLKGIMGVEMRVESVEGKAKLSQNRSVADRRGVIAGLAGEPYPRADEVAAAMGRHLTDD